MHFILSHIYFYFISTTNYYYVHKKYLFQKIYRNSCVNPENAQSLYKDTVSNPCGRSIKLFPNGKVLEPALCCHIKSGVGYFATNVYTQSIKKIKLKLQAHRSIFKVKKRLPRSVFWLGGITFRIFSVPSKTRQVVL